MGGTEADHVPFDVFLSHAHVDAQIVEQLAVVLQEAQLRVWLDKWVLIPGELWQQKIARALDEVVCCAVCLGGKATEGWFREEINRALNRQTRDKTFRVIPVLLPQAPVRLVDDFLELRTWVVFKDSIDDVDARHLLISGIRGIPPGRRPSSSPGRIDQGIREKLLLIQQLREDKLIEREVAREYQRRVLDRLMAE